MQSRETPTAQAIPRTGVVGLMAATGPAVWLVGGAILFTAGCDGMADGPAAQKAPAVETRKTFGKTTQNVLQLSEARKAGGEVAEMTITGEGIDVYADAYRTSVGKLAMIAVTQKMQLHNAEHAQTQPPTKNSCRKSSRWQARWAAVADAPLLSGIRIRSGRQDDRRGRISC